MALKDKLVTLEDLKVVHDEAADLKSAIDETDVYIGRIEDNIGINELKLFTGNLVNKSINSETGMPTTASSSSRVCNNELIPLIPNVPLYIEYDSSVFNKPTLYLFHNGSYTSPQDSITNHTNGAVYNADGIRMLFTKTGGADVTPSEIMEGFKIYQENAESYENRIEYAENILDGHVMNKTNDAGELNGWRYGYKMNVAGRFAAEEGYISTSTGDACLYLLKGSRFRANSGFVLDYSFFRSPITGSSGTSDRIDMARGVESGVTIVVPQDCYVGLSFGYANGSLIPSSADPDEMASTAISGVFYTKCVIDEMEERLSSLENGLQEEKTIAGWEIGAINGLSGKINHSYDTYLICPAVISSVRIYADEGYVFLPFGWDGSTFLGWWKNGAFYAGSGSASYYASSFDTEPMTDAGADTIRLMLKREDGEAISVNEGAHVHVVYNKMDNVTAEVETKLEEVSALQNVANDYTMLVAAQTRVAEDWHFPLINVWRGLGLGSKHKIPGTTRYALWGDGDSTHALDQRGVWMKDGTHPHNGIGITRMYARTIAEQIKLISPSYRTDAGTTDTSNHDWGNCSMLWLGTSIPAGDDDNNDSTSEGNYPNFVAQMLGATVTNEARGKSCLRINASTGEYTGMLYAHFLRSITRTLAECDLIAADWANIYPKLSGMPGSVSPTELSSGDINTMKACSYENKIVPYLDGTNPPPDLWVIDYGHNDVPPRDIYGKQDTYIDPTVENIQSGLLAEDTYMTDNSYANLKTAMGGNSSLDGITDLAGFAASVNRNCFKGATNFLITIILRYNPYARIAIITDYD